MGGEKVYKKQGPAGQRWVLGHFKQIHYIKEFQHIQHIQLFKQFQSWTSRPTMSPWAMGHWVMGHWVMSPWAMGPWAIGPMGILSTFSTFCIFSTLSTFDGRWVKKSPRLIRGPVWSMTMNAGNNAYNAAWNRRIALKSGFPFLLGPISSKWNCARVSADLNWNRFKANFPYCRVPFRRNEKETKVCAECVLKGFEILSLRRRLSGTDITVQRPVARAVLRTQTNRVRDFRLIQH